MIKFHQMKRILKRISTLQGLALVMLITAFFFLPLWKDDDLKRDTITSSSSYIEGLKIVNRSKGDTTWTIVAKRADFTKDERKARMNSIVIDIKKENLILNADSGIFDIETRDIKLEDNIILKAKGYEVALKNLSWNPSKSLLSSDQKIVLKGNRFSIEGEGLSATEEQKLSLHKNVRAIFY
jgi:LPS export ABC transporter protein LptC